jgi:hypothetical protein
LGVLALHDGERMVFSCPCLGRADALNAAQAGNPTRDPLRRNGDTPTGQYTGRIERHAMEPERNYGKCPPIRLIPTGGDALIAHNNGRRGLLIHGGHLWPNGIMRPANGCVRVEDKYQNAILSHLRRAAVTEFPIQITEAP